MWISMHCMLSSLLQNIYITLNFYRLDLRKTFDEFYYNSGNKINKTFVHYSECIILYCINNSIYVPIYLSICIPIHHFI